MQGSLGKFASECRANVALMVAVMSVPLTGLVCGAVDFARYSSAQVQLRTALAEGIEQARLQAGPDRVTASVRQFVSGQVDNHIQPESVEIIVPDTAFGDTDTEIRARARVETLFLRIIGIRTLDLSETVPAHFAPDPLTDITIALGMAGQFHWAGEEEAA